MTRTQITSYTKQTAVLGGLFALVGFLPLFVLPLDVPTILTVISLLFAILVGFYFAAVTSNHLNLQTLIPEANATLIGIYNHAKLVNPRRAKKVAEAIDAYLIAVLDYALLTYAPFVRKELKDIVDAVDELMPTDALGENIVSNLHSMKMDLISSNQTVALLAQNVLTPSHWLVVIVLTGLTDLLLLTLRDGQLVNTVIVGVLFITPYLMLRLLYELDTNAFLARSLGFRAPQNVFETIGKLPYYPETAFNIGAVRGDIGTHRLGTYVDQSRSNKKRITIVRSKRSAD